MKNREVFSRELYSDPNYSVTETLEIARDVAKKLLEAQAERQGQPVLKQTGDSFDYPLVVSD